MRRIIYHSKVAPEVDRAELFRLVYHARMANEQRGFSGFLLFVENRFLQVLEGEAFALLATFEKIRRDGRHGGVQIVDERSISAPIFGAWRMRCFEDACFADALEAIAREACGPVPNYVEAAIRTFFHAEQERLTHRRMIRV